MARRPRRYVTRPAISLERLSTNAAGKVVYELASIPRWHDPYPVYTRRFHGALAALVPRPRANLTRYHGVFAPNSRFRKAVVAGSSKPAQKKRKKPATSIPTESGLERNLPTVPLSWAARLKRVFAIDISICPRCSGTLRVIAEVTDPDAIRSILAHVKQRAPPHTASLQKPLQASQNDLFCAS